MRSTPFVQKPSTQYLKSIIAAKNGYFMITAYHGPTSFTILETPGMDAAMPAEELLALLQHNKKEFRVCLGSPHSCTCAHAAKEHFCVHIAFLVLRRFRIPDTLQLAFYTSWTDAELEQVLSGTFCNASSRRNEQQTQSYPAVASDVENQRTVARAEITDETYCAICLETLAGVDPSLLPFCKYCGNSVHERCLYMLLAAARGSGQAARCIYCRGAWCDGRSAIYADGKAARASKRSNHAIRSVIPSKTVCSICREQLPPGGFVTRYFGGDRVCFFCLLETTAGSFALNGRAIIPAPKVAAPAPVASSERYRIYAILQQRDITYLDYEALLRLDDPHVDARADHGAARRLPAFLALRGLRENRSGELFQCQMCGCSDINLCALLEVFEFSEPVPDWEAFARELRESESPYYVDDAKRFLYDNTQFFLPCAYHAIHAFCGLVCSCRAPVLRIGEVKCQAKLLGDMCPVCNFPCLPEWLRGAHLAKKPQAVKYAEKYPSGPRELKFEARRPRVAGGNAAPTQLLSCLRVNALPTLK